MKILSNFNVVNRNKKFSLSVQYLISFLLIVFISILCFFASEIIGYKVVALILLVVVSLLAMVFDILPVMLAAFLSALVWNFFFIPPLFTFHIADTEDSLMFLMYFLIASVNAVLTLKIREVEKKARDKEEKEKTIKLYNTILNSLSHELRTPISTIIGSVDTLKENREKISIENQEKLLSEIEMAGSRLNRQVENLLNISRLESGNIQLKLDWCDVSELIYSVIQKLPNLQNPNRIIVEIPENFPLIKLDSGLIEQVLYNIINNAMIYTPLDAKIEVSVKQKSEVCQICIADNGIGFPMDTIPFVFDKFFRLPQTKSGGTGLGLSIAKGFTEAHGGKILLENRMGGGAMFTILLAVETSYLNNLKNE